MTLSTAINGGGSGGGASARSAKVTNGATGVVATISTGLKAPLTVARDSGSTSITFAASGNKLTAAIASALAVGSSLSAIARVTQSDGAGVLIPVTLTGVAATPAPSPTPTPTPSPSPTISGTPNAIVAGRAYTFTPTVSGTGNSYALAGDSAALPNGLTLDTSTGAVSGTVAAVPNGGEVKGVKIVATNSSGSATLACSFPVKPRLMWATNANRVGKTPYTVPATRDRYILRCTEWISKDSAMRSMAPVFGKWQITEDQTTPEFPRSGSYQVLEIVAVYNGVAKTILALGDTPLTVDATGDIVGPEAAATLWGSSTFPASAVWEWRFQFAVVAGEQMTLSKIISNSVNGVGVPTVGSHYVFTASENPGISVAQTGALPTLTNGTVLNGANGNFALGFMGTKGEYDTPRRYGNATIIEGDSINDNGMGMRALGWMQGAGNIRAGFQCSVFGFMVKEAIVNDTKRTELRKAADTGYTNLGTNDLSAANRTFAQIRDDSLTLYGKWRAAGISRVIHSLMQQRVTQVPILTANVSGNVLTITTTTTAGITSGNRHRILTLSAELNTTSATATAVTVVNGTTLQFTYASAPTTQGAITVSGGSLVSDEYRSKGTQRPNAGYESGGTRDQFNTWLQSLAANGPDLVPDTVTPTSDPTDNHVWLTNGNGQTGLDNTGTINYLVSDGTHQNTVGEALAAVPITAAVDAA